MTPTVKVGVTALLVVLGAAAGIATFLSSPFRITRIVVRGADSAIRAETETLVRRYVDERTVLAGAPRLFLLRPSILARELEAQLPRLATVHVLRRLPGTLELDLQEQVPVAYLELAGHTFSLDSIGRIIAEVSSDDARHAGLPLVRDARTSFPVRLGDAALSRDIMAILHDVVVQLPERFAVSVTELSIPSLGADEVRVQTDRGWFLALDGRRPLTDQLRTFEKVVTEELSPDDLERIEYVDLRIPGKVYYRLR